MTRYSLHTTVNPSAVDAAAGVIRGVSVITEGPALGHGVMIDAESIASVCECCQQFPGGLRVKMNHGTGADAIIGVLRDFRIDGDQLRADLHLLKSHPMRAVIIEMAETIPHAFGLSISFSGQVEERDKQQFVRCLEIYSCDIVDEPAANPTGLFSRAHVDTQRAGMFTQEQFDAELNAKTAAQAQAQKNFADYTAAAKERDEFKAKADELAAKLATSDKALAEANEKIGKHADELKTAQEVTTAAVNAKAVEILSAAGHAPLNQKSGPTGGEDTATMTRADFNKLPARAQSDFCKAGGVIKD